MNPSRLLALLLGLVCSLWLLADTAAARSSRNNRNNRDSRNNRGGRHRVIGDDDDDEKKKEEIKKREEGRKKKAEAKKQAAEEKKQKAAEKKKALQEARKPRTETAKKTTAKKPKAKATAAKKKPGPAAGEKEAAALYAKAEKELDDGNLLPGVLLLRQAAAEHSGTKAAAQAKEWLDHLMSQEKYAALITHEEAEAAFAAQRYRQAQNKYGELLAKYPKSEQAAAAKERLAEIKEGDLLSKTVYTEEELEDARLWFLAGNIHMENRRQADALGAYRTAIEQYPGSPYALQAAEKVVALR